MENKIKVQNANLGTDLKISVPNTDYAVSVTNNRAQYYSEQAKKYRDEAKNSRDEAKYYAEQNSNVTYEYIENMKNSLLQQINSRQIQGDYALSSDIPQKVSELVNDKNYMQNSEFISAADNYLSNLTDTAKDVLKGNGAFWGYIQGEISSQTDLLNMFSQKLDLNASNLTDVGKSTLSGFSLPSGRYIELTLGASGSTYTAPANGWLNIYKSATTGQYVLFEKENGYRIVSASAPTNNSVSLLVPVKKDDVVTVNYTASGVTQQFRFIYAEGN